MRIFDVLIPNESYIEYQSHNISLKTQKESTKMGTSALTPQITITAQLMSTHINSLFMLSPQKLNLSNMSPSISLILSSLQQIIPIQRTPQGYKLNPVMIRIFHHKEYLLTIGKSINLLLDQMQKLMARTLIRVGKKDWERLERLANFILFFTDDRMIKLVETLNIRSDLHPQTQKIVKQLQNQNFTFQASQNLINKYSYPEIQKIQKCLRISLYQMINMRNQAITRSHTTLKVVQKLQQACFMLYIKVLFCTQHTKALMTKAQTQFFKANLTIGQYFLGKGSDLKLACIYQCSIIFLVTLLNRKIQNVKSFKALPSHLFKSLPIVSHNTAFDFIVNICLFTLTYVREGTNLYNRLAINRIMTLKLVDLIFKQINITSMQITYYLEELCIQTKMGQIQRSFVTGVVQKYTKLIQQLIQYNQTAKLAQKGKFQVKFPHPLCTQYRKSQIFQKYLQIGKQNYKIKFTNKQFKITTLDIITQLQNDENMFQTEFKILCQKYIYQVLLRKKVVYQYNDRQLWSEILPGIVNDRNQDQDDDMIVEHDQAEVKKSTMIRQQPVTKAKTIESLKVQSIEATTEQKFIIPTLNQLHEQSQPNSNDVSVQYQSKVEVEAPSDEQDDEE